MHYIKHNTRMDIIHWMPFYAEIKLGGMMACALCAALAGSGAIYIAAFAMSAGVRFEKAVTFSLFAAIVIWVLPWFAVRPPLSLTDVQNTFAVLAAIFLCMPILKLYTGCGFLRAAILWLAFAAAQAAVYYAAKKYVFS